MIRGEGLRGHGAHRAQGRCKADICRTGHRAQTSFPCLQQADFDQELERPDPPICPGIGLSDEYISCPWESELQLPQTQSCLECCVAARLREGQVLQWPRSSCGLLQVPVA